MNDPDNTQSSTLAERTTAITNSIASGHNACGTLISSQTGSLNTEFIAKAVRPTLEVYEGEAKQLREENAALRRDVEAKRFALESLVANVAIPAGSTMDAVRAALPGHPNLN